MLSSIQLVTIVGVGTALTHDVEEKQVSNY